MKITTNKVVSVSYQLHANLPSEEKKHIETADASHPLTFLYGTGGMIPGFERNLDGLSIGEKFSFSIEADEAYGTNDPNAIINLPIDIFKVDNVIDFEVLKAGNVLPMSDHEGNRMNGKVVSFNDAEVIMDFNHPLAGQTLHFSGEIVEVREASADELAHGHVHTGEHGH
ncbi:MAG: peptidylprolyl isomerase [Bacteroidetes bacterium]|nr:peptidylprolyl isomerase [Bacteroidota bacterium]